MISDLLYARSEDGKDALTFAEVVALSRALVVGGNETIATALSNLMYFLATRPDIAAQLEEVRNDDIKLSRFVEELIRIEPPARGTWRMTTREVEVGGKKLPAGARIMLLYASANDDEQVLDKPRDFDMNRRNIGKHLAFGAGIHLCVGIALARMEVKVGAREIAKRLKDIKLAIPAEDIRYVPTISVLSMESLPLTFSRRT
jgi:cytochrome P450